MTTYLYVLLAFIVLCALWAGFQIWLTKQDPELGKRSLKCGNCGCDKQCDEDRSTTAVSSADRHGHHTNSNHETQTRSRFNVHPS